MDGGEKVRQLELRLAVTEMIAAEALARGFEDAEQLRAWGNGVLAQAEQIAEKRDDPRLTAEYLRVWEAALALAVRQLEARRRRRGQIGD